MGNQAVPYIYEDYISHKTLADSFMKMYEMGPAKRKELGALAMAHAHKDYNIDDTIKMWDETLTTSINKWKSNENKLWSHTEI